jgi:hypothetical protein
MGHDVATFEHQPRYRFPQLLAEVITLEVRTKTGPVCPAELTNFR